MSKTEDVRSQGLRMKIPTECSKNIMCKPEKSYDHPL